MAWRREVLLPMAPSSTAEPLRYSLAYTITSNNLAHSLHSTCYTQFGVPSLLHYFIPSHCFMCFIAYSFVSNAICIQYPTMIPICFLTYLLFLLFCLSYFLILSGQSKSCFIFFFEGSRSKHMYCYVVRRLIMIHFN